jgi:alpha-galactosidase
MKRRMPDVIETVAVLCSLLCLPLTAAETAATNAPAEPTVLLTPKPPRTPRINGAKVFGVRPGNPFLYTIAATGDRPMTFSAEGLPSGLQLATQTGRITGMLKDKGEYVVTLRAQNSLGKAERKFKIRCGSQLGLTPAMGWNSWNAFGEAISDELARIAADAMVKDTPYGRLSDHGWTYINLDDGWQRSPREGARMYEGPTRDAATGKILPNKKFSDMEALGDYIHNLGLKYGIYSSPGPRTCQNLEGTYQHERIDAQSWAEWGVDYVKYDWCSYGEIANRQARARVGTNAPSTDTNAPAGPGRRRGPRVPLTREDHVKPYRILGEILAQAPRDILFSLCQYGMDNVWDWAPQIGGNSWRTTGDITDTWKSLSAIGFAQGGHPQDVGPGHFDDPDMLIVGNLGWGPRVRPTRLTPNEQYTHISLWCLLASPLLLGCDMAQLDEFTLNLLCNDEVLAVNQDPLGRQGTHVTRTDSAQVWAKDMEDGSKAVGLFNLAEENTKVTIKWADLGLTGPQAVRDLWRQRDLGKLNAEFTAEVPRHGVVLVRVAAANAGGR